MHKKLTLYAELRLGNMQWEDHVTPIEIVWN
jgi:hypothetical protein